MLTNLILNENEHLLWSGKPRVGIFFTQHDIFIVPLSFIFIPAFIYIFKAFLKTLSVNLDWNLLCSLIGFVFVFLVYLYITIGRKIQDLYYKLNVIYIITSKRVVIWDDISRKYVFNKNNTEINPTLIQVANRRGSINLGEFISENNLTSYKYGWPSKEVLFKRFEGIEDAAKVYELLIKAKNDCLQSRNQL